MAFRLRFQLPYETNTTLFFRVNTQRITKLSICRKSVFAWGPKSTHATSAFPFIPSSSVRHSLLATSRLVVTEIPKRATMDHTHQSPPSFIFQQDHHLGKSSLCSGFGAILGNASMPRKVASNNSRSDVKSEKKELDKFLAKSMHKLSVKDREQALEEVNGIASDDPEDPNTLNKCLQELDEHLNSIKQGTFYQMAEQMDKDYVNNRKFRVMFLRANRYLSNGNHRYDPREAAGQMLNFFETKTLLFGKQKLVKDITLDDLDDDEKNGLKRGNLQVLPVCDRAGRPIIVNFRGHSCFKSVRSELKAKFYLFMSVIACEETQKKGIVVVFYTVGRYRDKILGNTVPKQSKHVLAIPYHWAGLQVCCDDYSQYVILRALFQLLPAHNVARVRVHYGTHMECLYALRGFGIPEGSIPISPTDANLLLTNHMIWYKERLKIDMEKNVISNTSPVGPDSSFGDLSLDLGSPNLDSDEFSHHDTFTELGGVPAVPYTDAPFPKSGLLEANQSATTTDISPQTTDVLFGQNQKLHPGNVRLRDIISKHAEKYEFIGGRQKKIEFAGRLVQQIKATGSRFLILDKASMRWTEVPDTKARNKVAKTIRNRRRKVGSQY